MEEHPSSLNVYHGINYFDPLIADEDCPLKVSDETNEKYEALEKIFNTFFTDNSLNQAKDASQLEREAKHLQEGSFVYGEITFRSIAYIFEYIKSNYELLPGDFIDLGSGTGRGVSAAIFCYSFEKYIGVEYLESLFDISMKLKDEYQRRFSDILKQNKGLFPGGDTIDVEEEKEEEIKEPEKKEEEKPTNKINDLFSNRLFQDMFLPQSALMREREEREKKEKEEKERKEKEEAEKAKALLPLPIPEVEFIHNNFLKVPIKKASFVLANSTCFSTELMVALSKKCDAECKIGCLVITFTKKLPSLGPHWEVKKAFRRMMSWGIATVFIHRKKDNQPN